MPSHKVHAYVDRLYFGKVYWKMHLDMDWPVYFVKKNHRIYFHDMTAVNLIALKRYPGDPNAVQSGWLHIQVDWACTNNPAYGAQLELLADQDIKERKREKRKRPKSKPDVSQKELLKLQREVKKLAQIQALVEKISSH